MRSSTIVCLAPRKGWHETDSYHPWTLIRCGALCPDCLGIGLQNCQKCLAQGDFRGTVFSKMGLLILTGMGMDGAKGMLKMRQKGFHTLGQSKESCVVYGMPMEAYKLGAVVAEYPCEQIAGAIMKYLNAYK